MGATVLDRAVLELGVDGSKLFSETEKAVKGLAARVKATLGKDLKSAFSGIEDAVGGFKDLAGQSNPLAAALDNVLGKAKGLGAGFAALGPVAGGIAIALAAISAAALAGVAALAAIGATIYSWTRSAANAGDELNTLSNRFSLTAEAISGFQYIGKQADVSIEAITTGIFKLGQTMSEGGKKVIAAAKAIGTSLGTLRTMSQEDAFTAIITGLGKIPDAGKRAAAGVAFFGKQFKELANLTKEDMAGLIAKGQEVGAIFSQEFAVAGDRFNDAMTNVRMAIDGVTTRIGAAFLPMGIAIAETFGVALSRALLAGGTSVSGFSEIVAKVSVRIGQSLAAVVSIGANAARFLAEFFSGGFLRGFGLIDYFARLALQQANYLKLASLMVPALRPIAAQAAEAAARMALFAKEGTLATVTVGGNLIKYADAVQLAADQTGIALPAAIAKVQKEIKDQAAAARAAITDNEGFGASLGEDVAEGADKAAAALKKLNEERAQTVAEIRAVGAVLADYGSRLVEVVAVQERWEASLPQFDQLMPMVQGYSVEAEIAATTTGLLEDAFSTLGMTSRASLQTIADNAKKAYEEIARQLGATSKEAIAAFKKWQEASRAASQEVARDWSNLFTGVQQSMMAFSEVGVSFAEQAANAVKGMFDSIGDEVVTSLNSEDGLATKLNEWVTDTFSGLGTFMSGLLGSLAAGGLTALASLAINKVSEFIGNLINKPSMKANNERDVAMTKIAKEFGGTGLSGTGTGTDFSIVAAKLNAATGSNELFERFLKADTPEKFAAVLTQVNAALDDYKKKTDAAAEATKAQAEEIDAVTKASTARMDALRQEMVSLNEEVKKWDELEAPEEVMGTVERLAREKIAQQQAAVQAEMDQQQQIAEEALAAIAQGATDAGAEAGRGISDGFQTGFDRLPEMTDEALRDMAERFGKGFDVPIRFTAGDFPMPSVPVTPAAHGFDGMVTSPRLFLAGEGNRPERVTITPTGAGASDKTSVVVVVLPHGGTVRDVLNVLPKEARRNEGQFGAKLGAALAPYGVR